MAGVGKMTYSRFLPLDILGGFIWIYSLTFAGFLFGNIPFIKNNLSFVILAIIALSLMPLFLSWMRHRRRIEA